MAYAGKGMMNFKEMAELLGYFGIEFFTLITQENGGASVSGDPNPQDGHCCVHRCLIRKTCYLHPLGVRVSHHEEVFIARSRASWQGSEQVHGHPVIKAFWEFQLSHRRRS